MDSLFNPSFDNIRFIIGIKSEKHGYCVPCFNLICCHSIFYFKNIIIYIPSLNYKDSLMVIDKSVKSILPF